MPRINRAAQFAPFDALKGLQNALRQKELEHEKKVYGELSEEQKNDLLEATLSLDRDE